MNRIEEAISGTKYGCNLFECTWYQDVGEMLDLFLASHFTDDGQDLVSWWLFEDVDKVIYEKTKPDLFDSNEGEIEISVKTLDELWDYMFKHKEDYFL